MNSIIEEKQIELAERLSNYIEILQFVKTKIPEDELDIYLGFFKQKSEISNVPKSENDFPGMVLDMFGNEIL